MVVKAKMKPYPCIEETLDIYFDNKQFVLRLWVNKKILENDVAKGYTWLGRVCAFVKEKHTFQEIIRYVEKEVPNINAAQVKQVNHNSGIDCGLVAYFVDFSEDVHG